MMRGQIEEQREKTAAAREIYNKAVSLSPITYSLCLMILACCAVMVKLNIVEFLS